MQSYTQLCIRQASIGVLLAWQCSAARGLKSLAVYTKSSLVSKSTRTALRTY
jgi:hypothetical protein